MQHDNPPMHMIVVGDFMVDKEWILSGIPLPTVQSHGLVQPMQRIHPTWRSDRLGGAGMALMALRTKLNELPRHIILHGLGVWNKNDHEYLCSMANTSQKNTFMHRLNTQECFDVNNEIVTTTKYRFYTQLAEEMPRLINRYDQDPEPDPERPPSDCDIYTNKPLANFEENLRTIYNGTDLKSIKSRFKYIFVADSNKGAIQRELLESIHSFFSGVSNIEWIIDSKNPNILDILPDNARVNVLTVNRDEAIRLNTSQSEHSTNKDIFSIASGYQPGIDLLSTINGIKQAIEETEKSIDYLVIKLDSEGACLHNLKDHDKVQVNTFICQPEKSLDCPGIAAGDFFNAGLIATIIQEESGIYETLHLQKACIYAAEWLLLNQLYWSTFQWLRDETKSDVVLPEFLETWKRREPTVSPFGIQNHNWDKVEAFNLKDKLEELNSVYEYEKMFTGDKRGKEKKIMLSHAKGFLGNYLSANLSLRKKIHSFVEQLTTYSLSKGRTRPLNCLVTAPPGSGKSFFVQQLSKEVGCGLVEINLSQITTTDELVRGISQLNDIQTGTPMLFLDEIDSNPEFFRFLLSPLWEASVLVNGRKIKWSERFIAILAASQNPFDLVPPIADQGLLERLKSRINGPELKLMETGIDREQQEEDRIRTSNIYLLIDIILRYHKSARLVEARILDLIYCAEIDRFNARSLEHFISAFPSPNDGIVKLSNVPPQKLGEFLCSLGYKIKEFDNSLVKHPLSFDSTTRTGQQSASNKRIGDLYQKRRRPTHSDGILHTDSLDRSLITIIA